MGVKTAIVTTGNNVLSTFGGKLAATASDADILSFIRSALDQMIVHTRATNSACSFGGF
jgi:hypothetical protein